MLRNGLRSDGSRPASRGLARERRELVGGEREARERAAQVRAALAELRVERVRARHVLLDEVFVVIGARRCRGRGWRRSAAVDRVFAGLVERDELVVLLVVREVEARRDLHRRERDLARTLKLLDQRRELSLARRAVQAADPDVDRMDLAPADDRHHSFPVFFSASACATRSGSSRRARSRSRSRGSPARGA